MILLDTHVLARLVFEPKKLSRPATRAIERAARSGGLGIASITVWELACLFARGRIRHPGTVDAAVARVVLESRVVVREITPVVAALAAQFPADFPGDPADRLIAATARAEGIPLVTADERIRECPLVETVW